MISFLKRLKSKLKLSNEKSDFIDNSKEYWEQRYIKNKNSGSGSYGRLAEFKAEVLNTFVVKHFITSVIELGCGDGNQLGLATYPKYIGFDVSNKAVDICKTMFKDDMSKQFYNMSEIDKLKPSGELVLSLDVIYHLIEDTVFNNYMHYLFSIATEYVIIYSSNYNAYLAKHVKCRKFTDWIEQNTSDTWELFKFIENKYPFAETDPENTSMADFYIYKKIN